MTAGFFVIVIGIWVLYSGWKFYRQVNWSEAPISTPDFGAMRKREAELLHIQEVLEEAHIQGKISAALLMEYNRFFDTEVAEMRSAKGPADEPKQSGSN